MINLEAAGTDTRDELLRMFDKNINGLGSVEIEGLVFERSDILKVMRPVMYSLKFGEYLRYLGDDFIMDVALKHSR